MSQIGVLALKVEAELLAAAKKDAVAAVEVVSLHIGDLLDAAAADIPGVIDDVVIAALKPALVAAAQSLVDQLKAKLA